MNKLAYILISAMITVFFGCTNKKNHTSDAVVSSHQQLENRKVTLSLNDFVKWCANDENKLKKSKELSDITYELIYMPAETMAYLELRTESYDQEAFKKAYEHYTGMTYFNLRIKQPGSGEVLKYNLSSPSQYEARVKYLSFEVQDDIAIIQNGDTLKPGLCQFERAFDVTPYVTVMLGFDHKKFDNQKEFTLLYNDKLFNKGPVQFNYQNQQLIDIPNIREL